MAALRHVHVALTELVCGTCGVAHAIPESMHTAFQAEGGFWFCPNGHQRGWGTGTTAAALKAAQEALQAEKERHARTLTRVNAAETAKVQAEKALTRHKTRAKNGVCPCCNRTFKQLAAHMKNKHPTYEV